MSFCDDSQGGQRISPFLSALSSRPSSHLAGQKTKEDQRRDTPPIGSNKAINGCAKSARLNDNFRWQLSFSRKIKCRHDLIYCPLDWNLNQKICLKKNDLVETPQSNHQITGPLFELEKLENVIKRAKKSDAIRLASTRCAVAACQSYNFRWHLIRQATHLPGRIAATQSRQNQIINLINTKRRRSSTRDDETGVTWPASVARIAWNRNPHWYFRRIFFS